MMFKFCRLALSLLSLVGALHAQTPAPSPTPTKKPKEAYFRFWNMLPRGSGELRIVQSSAVPDADPILRAEPMNYYANYQLIPLGRYNLKVISTAQPAKALGNFDVLLRDDVFVTFLARKVGDTVKVEMIDDTYDRTLALTGKLMVYQQFPNATVTVTTTANPAPITLTYGTSQAFDALPLQNLTFRIQAVFPDGRRKSITADADFRSARHTSLLIMPDIYDRFRTRIASDGQTGS